MGGSGSGDCVQMVAQAVACPGTVVSVRVAAQGKLRARRGLSARAEEGNVIENEGGGGELRGSLFINLLGHGKVPEVPEEPQVMNLAIFAKFMPASTSMLQNNNKI